MFATEARMRHALPKRQIANERMRIRSAICAGQPGEAVALINASFPDVSCFSSPSDFIVNMITIVFHAPLISSLRARFDEKQNLYLYDSSFSYSFLSIIHGSIVF